MSDEPNFPLRLDGSTAVITTTPEDFIDLKKWMNSNWLTSLIVQKLVFPSGRTSAVDNYKHEKSSHRCYVANSMQINRECDICSQYWWLWTIHSVTLWIDWFWIPKVVKKVGRVTDWAPGCSSWVPARSVLPDRTFQNLRATKSVDQRFWATYVPWSTFPSYPTFVNPNLSKKPFGF